MRPMRPACPPVLGVEESEAGGNQGKAMGQIDDVKLEDRIRERAHALWEQAGQPEGREHEFWYDAERDVREMEQLHDEATAPPPTLLPG
jgi:hypothetical protein